MHKLIGKLSEVLRADAVSASFADGEHPLVEEMDLRTAAAVELEQQNASLQQRVEALELALKHIAELESSTCPACEGNGNRYADGRAHYPSERAPTVACSMCGGTGQIASEEAAIIATEALAAAQDKGGEQGEGQ